MLQVNLQMTHLMEAPNTVAQTSPTVLVQPLLLLMHRNTNERTVMAMEVTLSWEIRLQKHNLLLICGPWHAHQHFTSCWGCKSLPNALLTHFLRTLPIAKSVCELLSVLTTIAPVKIVAELINSKMARQNLNQCIKPINNCFANDDGHFKSIDL